MEKYKSDPNFLDHFSANADDLILGMKETEDQLGKLELMYLNQILVRKSCTQSGFQKRKYPVFSGDVLNYYEFKQRWREEVSLEQKPEIFEVNALKDLLPDLAKNKLHKIKSLQEAWKILVLLYG